MKNIVTKRQIDELLEKSEIKVETVYDKVTIVNCKLPMLIRITGLQRMLESYKAGKLPFQPNCSYELLYEQFVHMKGYLNALELRATIEKISLEKENKNEQSNCC